MNNIVISVENLSKTYYLGQIGTGTFTNDLKLCWVKAGGKPNPFFCIGHIGAGKSIFLKILSRVTAPTSGKIKVQCGIASLSEVSTGFHPELTGRENMYLSGAIQ